MRWTPRILAPLVVHCLLLPATVLGLALIAAETPWPALPAALAALAAGASGAWLMRGLGREKAELCQRDEELYQAQKLAAIGEISAGVAHEINTPLGIILQEAEIMTLALSDQELDASALRDEIAPSVREIAAQVDRCRGITHRMLSFSRRDEPVPQYVDVNQVAEDMARLVEREAANAGVILERAYDEDLPALVTDMPQLRQVLLNLFNNALQALQGKAGGVIRLTTSMAGGWVALEVWDNGPGIPEDIQAKIFDPFFTTKPPGVGTGLGLSISLRIVRQLGGRLTVASRPGSTAFTVFLPVAEPSARTAA